MADDTANPEPEASKDALDLNSLSSLNFGPDWADGKSSRSTKQSRNEGRAGGKPKGKRPGGGQSGRDRRGSKPHKGHARDQGRNQNRAHFEPTVKIDLYPQDEAFDALVKRLRTSARTYQLFEIAHLLLEKPERYVVVVSPKQKRGDDESKKPLLYYSVPGHLPFETEEEAINFVIQQHIDLFFDVEEIEVDPPSGNFQIINRCTVTGELLGPPNYHRYQEFLQQHYKSRISGMSFERFQSKIEGSKEQEDIDAWLESMKKGARYTVKDRQENEPESFDSLESARYFLINHRKDKVVGSAESVRFAGRDIERMPKGNLRRSVETYVEQQKHFPLDSANNIRGRLRRHKFAVYKKGSKGISYVCAVKRKFRDSKTVFTDSIRDLIEFIEKHPDLPASKLPKEYIGIDTEKQKPKSLDMKAGADVDASTGPQEATASSNTEEATATPKAEEAAAPQKAEEVPESPNTEEAPESSKAEEAPEPDEKSVEAKTALSEDTDSVEASTEAKPKTDLSEEEENKLNQLMIDLRWLITEGYVTEYGDGRLFAPAPMPEPSKKSETKSKPTETAAAKDKIPATASPEDSADKASDPEKPEAENSQTPEKDAQEGT